MVNGGMVGIFCWLLLIVLSLTGLVLGFLSWIQSPRSEGRGLPLSAKLLAVCALATLAVGAAGAAAGYIGLFAQLGTCSSKADAKEIFRAGSAVVNVIFFMALGASAFQSIMFGCSAYRARWRWGLDGAVPTKRTMAAMAVLIVVVAVSAVGASVAIGTLSDVMTMSAAERAASGMARSFRGALRAGVLVAVAGMALTALLALAAMVDSLKKRRNGSNGQPREME
jgi:hypothetical protein